MIDSGRSISQPDTLEAASDSLDSYYITDRFVALMLIHGPSGRLQSGILICFMLYNPQWLMAAAASAHLRLCQTHWALTISLTSLRA